MIDKLLEKAGLKYEDLTTDERATLSAWNSALESSGITLAKVKEYISGMREAVEKEVTTTENNTKQDIFLKARLRNYMLLEAYMSTPEKAKAQIENMIAGVVRSR